MASSFIKLLPVLFISIGIHLTAVGKSTGTVTYKELGLQFTIPNGWVGQESEGGFIMGHETTPGMIMILLHDQQYSIEQMSPNGNYASTFTIWNHIFHTKMKDK